MSKTFSRREFLRGAAAGAVGIGALGVMGGVSAAGGGAAASYAPQLPLMPADDTRRSDADMTPEEFIESKGEGTIMSSMMIGSVNAMGIPPEKFMLNEPEWLGTPPEITDFAAEYDCECVVVGAGNAGVMAALRAVELGLDTICMEVQTYNGYDNYICDSATYNANFFLEKGAPYQDPMEIFNEYTRKALGLVHPELIRSYVTRSGEFLDWMLGQLPQEIVENYAHAVNYKGNADFKGHHNHCFSFIGMTQWRDNEKNINMWPYVIRLLMKNFEEAGGRMLYGCNGTLLLQDGEGAVTGIIGENADGSWTKVNCRAVVVATGDYCGNPDMRLDLCDNIRSLNWSFGRDRTDAGSMGGGGRDGSGVKMCFWAGAAPEPTPHASMSGIAANSKPGFPIGGAWPCFGPDGKRFFNEGLGKFGGVGALNILKAGDIVTTVVDANWDAHCEAQGYGHETMDRSNPVMIDTVRAEMAAYVTGPDGFLVQGFSKYGHDCDRIYAAETLEELGAILGYEGEALESWLAEIEHWNQMCENKYDEDWGIDPDLMFPIKDAPFYGNVSVASSSGAGAMAGMGIICTDGKFNAVRHDRSPIPGLYAIGNTCGQRYAVQYHTPTAGNCGGQAMTNGYVVSEYVRDYIRA